MRAEVFALARGFAQAGFRVARVKIEATGSNRGLPQTDQVAQQTPDNYFEFHLKVQLHNQAEVAALLAVVRPFGAHLSRNARSISPDGVQQRFVTLRAYGVGQRTGWHFEQYDGSGPGRIEQGKLFQGQTIVQKQDGKYRIIKPAVKKNPEGNKQADISNFKR